MNLYSLLSEHDNKVIYNYITEHQIVKDKYIGNKEFLSFWSQSKTKLYHLLGNKFIHKIPFEHTRSNADIIDDMEYMKNKSAFYEDFRRYLDDIYSYMCENDIIDKYHKVYNKIGQIVSNRALVNNKISEEIVLDFLPNEKVIKIAEGTRPFKALTKLLAYTSKCETMVPPSEAKLEQFRCDVSMVLNHKVMKGNLVMSIHPMDFMTMSDNSYDWSSCMSWIGHGCYHQGTEEMMNSNNVICCYLESLSRPLFCFKDIKSGERGKEVHSPEEYPEYSWSNKKWRVLFYVTKDIICSGKSYPYEDTNLSKTILLELQRLAKKNMHWTYPFGVQEYYDHLSYSLDDVDLDSVLYNGRKSIVFNTRAMYHDMINDHDKTYLCVRRPVKKGKLISISGKVKCLCCGDDDIQEESDYREDYNDRYRNTGSLICSSCLSDEFYCGCCEADSGNEDVVYFANKPMVYVKGFDKVCFRCANEFIRKCPCCGDAFKINNWVTDNPIVRIDLDKTEPYYPVPDFYHLRKVYGEYAYSTTSELIGASGYAPLIMCDACKVKFLEEHADEFMKWTEINNPDIIVERMPDDDERYGWYYNSWDKDHYGLHLSNKLYNINDENITKFFKENLEKVSFEEFKN